MLQPTDLLGQRAPVTRSSRCSKSSSLPVLPSAYLPLYIARSRPVQQCASLHGTVVWFTCTKMALAAVVAALSTATQSGAYTPQPGQKTLSVVATMPWNSAVPESAKYQVADTQSGHPESSPRGAPSC